MQDTVKALNDLGLQLDVRYDLSPLLSQAGLTPNLNNKISMILCSKGEAANSRGAIKKVIYKYLGGKCKKEISNSVIREYIDKSFRVAYHPDLENEIIKPTDVEIIIFHERILTYRMSPPKCKKYNSSVEPAPLPEAYVEKMQTFITNKTNPLNLEHEENIFNKIFNARHSQTTNATFEMVIAQSNEELQIPSKSEVTNLTKIENKELNKKSKDSSGAPHYIPFDNIIDHSFDVSYFNLPDSNTILNAQLLGSPASEIDPFSCKKTDNNLSAEFNEFDLYNFEMPASEELQDDSIEPYTEQALTIHKRKERGPDQIPEFDSANKKSKTDELEELKNLIRTQQEELEQLEGRDAEFKNLIRVQQKELEQLKERDKEQTNKVEYYENLESVQTIVKSATILQTSIRGFFACTQFQILQGEKMLAKLLDDLTAAIKTRNMDSANKISTFITELTEAIKQRDVNKVGAILSNIKAEANENTLSEPRELNSKP